MYNVDANGTMASKAAALETLKGFMTVSQVHHKETRASAPGNTLQLHGVFKLLYGQSGIGLSTGAQRNRIVRRRKSIWPAETNVGGCRGVHRRTGGQLGAR